MLTTYYDTKKFGWLKLSLDERSRVVAAAFVDRPGKSKTLPPALKTALDAYVSKGTGLTQTLFVWPAAGTAFQQSVWRAIAAVPRGETITYTELAAAAGRPRAVRGAGTACGKNPLALFIPCHRVVSKGGRSVAYAWGAERKRALLQHEGILT